MPLTTDNPILTFPNDPKTLLDQPHAFPQIPGSFRLRAGDGKVSAWRIGDNPINIPGRVVVFNPNLGTDQTNVIPGLAIGLRVASGIGAEVEDYFIFWVNAIRYTGHCNPLKSGFCISAGIATHIFLCSAAPAAQAAAQAASVVLLGVNATQFSATSNANLGLSSPGGT